MILGPALCDCSLVCVGASCLLNLCACMGTACWSIRVCAESSKILRDCKQ